MRHSSLTETTLLIFAAAVLAGAGAVGWQGWQAYRAADERVRGLAFSPDGRMLVRLTRRSGIAAFELPSGRRTWTTPYRNRGHWPRVSFQDDGTLAVAENGLFGVRRFHRDDGRPIPRAAGDGYVVAAHPTRPLRASLKDGELSVTDWRREAELLRVPVAARVQDTLLRFIGDGSRLVLLSGLYDRPAVAMSFDISDWTIAEQATGPAGNWTLGPEVAVSRHGDVVAYPGSAGRLVLLDLNAAEPQRWARSGFGRLESVVFTRDGAPPVVDGTAVHRLDPANGVTVRRWDFGMAAGKPMTVAETTSGDLLAATRAGSVLRLADDGTLQPVASGMTIHRPPSWMALPAMLTVLLSWCCSWFRLAATQRQPEADWSYWWTIAATVVLLSLWPPAVMLGGRVLLTLWCMLALALAPFLGIFMWWQLPQQKSRPLRLTVLALGGLALIAPTAVWLLTPTVQ